MLLLLLLLFVFCCFSSFNLRLFKFVIGFEIYHVVIIIIFPRNSISLGHFHTLLVWTHNHNVSFIPYMYILFSYCKRGRGVFDYARAVDF